MKHIQQVLTSLRLTSPRDENGAVGSSSALSGFVWRRRGCGLLRVPRAAPHGSSGPEAAAPPSAPHRAGGYAAEYRPAPGNRLAGLKSSGRMLQSALPRNWFWRSVSLLTRD